MATEKEGDQKHLEKRSGERNVDINFSGTAEGGSTEQSWMETRSL